MSTSPTQSRLIKTARKADDSACLELANNPKIESEFDTLRMLQAAKRSADKASEFAEQAKRAADAATEQLMAAINRQLRRIDLLRQEHAAHN